MTGDHDEQDRDGEARSTVKPYVAFLVRSWQEGPEMRYSLETIGTRERRGFDQAADLLAVLKNELEGGHS